VARDTAGGDASGYQAKLTAALADARIKAANAGVTGERRAAALAAAGDRQARQPVNERRALVTSVGYLNLLKDLLKAQLPLLLGVDSMRKPEVFARLCADSCGSLDDLRTEVSLLKQQVSEIKTAKQTKKAAKLLNTPRPGAAAVAAGEDGPSAADQQELLEEQALLDTACEKCGGKDEEETLLVCPSCDNCWHMACLVPALTELPTPGAWHCCNCPDPV
jgi:hypothetical protein